MLLFVGAHYPSVIYSSVGLVLLPAGDSRLRVQRFVVISRCGVGNYMLRLAGPRS
jgi:hypothetical protein